MQTFLPTLIFESAFGMDAHMFKKTLGQSLMLAVPGLILSTVFTAAFAQRFFGTYGWDWITSLIFGSILSATDPVAVVAVLRDAGIAPGLTMLIEGESLLNDGSAIVVFEVLLEMLTDKSYIFSVNHIVWKFFYISMGAVIFGGIMAVIAMFLLQITYNDAITEITITFAFAYLTYYIADAILGFSGVLAVVVLGIAISANKSYFSPEVENSVHHFWEMLSYLANTVIFIIVGIIITEQTLPFYTEKDFVLVLATYAGVTAFRMGMIVCISPSLTTLGVGLPVRHGIVLIWGGLRGAVGLALALMLTYNPAVDNASVANKILIQLSGIIVLTLVINAVTMPCLLRLIGMREVPVNNQLAVTHVVNHLRKVANASRTVHANDHFLEDADWLWVSQQTYVKNPYEDLHKKAVADMSVKNNSAESSCLHCSDGVSMNLTPKVYHEILEEGRLRVLKALKTCYWKVYEEGTMSRSTYQALRCYTDEAMDVEGEWVHLGTLITWQAKLFGITEVLAHRNRCFDYIKAQSSYLYHTYDVGFNYVVCHQEIMNKIKYIVNNPEMAVPLMKMIGSNIKNVLKEMSELQAKHPGIAVALKSKYAARRILNDVQRACTEMKELGVIEGNDSEVLDMEMNSLIKKVMHAPKYLSPIAEIQDILEKIDWLQDPRLKDIIRSNFVEKEFEKGQIINAEGSAPDAISIIVKGIVEISGSPVGQSKLLPNTDTLLYFQTPEKFFDYASTCYTLGLLGFLNRTQFVTSAVCETDVYLLHVPISVLQEAENAMTEKPPLRYVLWRNMALKLALSILKEVPHYKSWPDSKLRLKLDDSFIPHIRDQLEFEVGPLVEDIVLIQGRVKDYNGKSFVGPVHVASDTDKLELLDDPKDRGDIVLVLITREGYALPENLDWSGDSAKRGPLQLCFTHEVKHRISVFESELRKEVKRPGRLF